jgi:hypothetical protein
MSYLSVPLINAWQVDLADEGDLRRRVGILRSADDLEGVYAVLVRALYLPVLSPLSSLLPSVLPSDSTHVRWSEDGAVPVRHEQVIAFVQTV